MNNIKKWLLYSGYIIAATVFLLYFLFPSDAVKKYITYNIKKANPDLNIIINNINPVFPPGLKFHDVSLYRSNDPLFDADQIKISPRLLSFFSPNSTYFFKGKSYEGVLEGRAVFTKSTPAPQITIDANLSDIHIEEITPIQNLSGHMISGVLDGKLTYNGNKKLLGKVKADLRISDSKIELLTPVFDLENLTFRNIEAEMVLDNQKLHIKQCIMKGNQMDGRISGFVIMKDPLCKSVLNLTGTINPHSLFLGGLNEGLTSILFPKKKSGKSGFSFKIRGTFDKPRFSLN